MEKSSMIKTKDVGRGQTLNSAYPMDNASHTKLPDEMGGKCADTGLSRSISGASVGTTPGQDG